MDKVVGLLEEQYRTLLAETEAKAECQTQEYLRVLYIKNINFKCKV